MDRTMVSVLAEPRQRVLAGAGTLLLLFVVALVSVLDLRPPAARDAAPSEFSGTRAFAHVSELAREPHPSGTSQNVRVRDSVVAKLRSFGLRPELHEGVGRGAGELKGYAARASSVVAVIPGTAPTGRVFLAAHYDSATQGSRGAADDGVGVAAVLETARALVASGKRLRNDMVLLITDAEEAGLMGAEAFVTSHPLGRAGRRVVFNYEAAGSKGPAMMYRTSQGNAPMIGWLARAPHPAGDSVSAALEALAPGDTDVRVFRNAGFDALDTALVDGRVNYHTPLDDPAHLSRASVQHMGVNMLAMARTAGDADLAVLDGAGDAVYFGLPGDLLVHYPVGWALPLAGAGLVAVLALGWLVRRRRLASVPRMVAAFGLTLVPVVVSAGAGLAVWPVLTALRPGYADMSNGDPHRALLLRWAVTALGVLIVLAWYGAVRRWIGPAALALGGMAWCAVLGVVAALLVPGASHVLALPVLGAALGGLVALRFGEGSAARAVVLAVGLLPTALLLCSYVPPSYWVGLAGGAVQALPLVVLAGVLVLPQIEMCWPHRRGFLVPVAAALVVVVLAGCGVAVDRFDRAHPRLSNLIYIRDADAGTARWASSDRSPTAWLRRYVRGAAEPLGREWPYDPETPMATDPAPATSLPAPALKVLEDRTAGGERTLRVRITSPRGAAAVHVQVDETSARVLRAWVAGRAAELLDQGLYFVAPGRDGFELRLVVRPGVGKVRIRLADHSYGLTGVPGFVPPPPGNALRTQLLAVQAVREV
ncbi:M20/M25/M40 family metallo-hydrolase [Actinomadura hibisca]|uniref:M20/M25/M40 family metallo-hydrolase n=1 Tax=Actinomadura hibisca TaxID=68565 RepID=UPI000833F3A0|nr:M20/M25/M40 family metallo-hydrolase [Actinomadura hibisca]